MEDVETFTLLSWVTVSRGQSSAVTQQLAVVCGGKPSRHDQPERCLGISVLLCGSRQLWSPVSEGLQGGGRKAWSHRGHLTPVHDPDLERCWWASLCLEPWPRWFLRGLGVAFWLWTWSCRDSPVWSLWSPLALGAA